MVAGDVVVFFCAKRASPRSTTTDYFFIGIATGGEVVVDRSQIWSKQRYLPYRKHYNVLARYAGGPPVQHETFFPYHENWLHRLASPYVLFCPDQSRFNLKKPLHVGTSQGGKQEVWRSAQLPRVKKLENALFIDLGIKRRLRTSPTGSAHPHINLTRKLLDNKSSPQQLRSQILPLV